MAIELVDRFNYRFSDEKKQEIDQWIKDQKWAISVDRKEFIDRRVREFSKYDDFVSPVRKGPWEDASNVRTPITKVMLDVYVAKLYNIFTNKRTVVFSKREKMDAKKAAIFSMLREWYMYDYINEYRGIKPVLKELCNDVCEIGYGLIFKAWELIQRKKLVIVENEIQREFEDFAPEAIAEMKKGGKANVKPYKEIQKVVDAFEGTMLRTVPFESCYFPNNIPESSNLDYPPLVVVTVEYDISEIQMKVNQGLWDKDEAEAIIKTEPQNRYSKDYGQQRQVQQVRESNTGYNAYNSLYRSQKRDLDFCFVRYDVDDDGIYEDIVVVRNEDGNWLSALPLDRYSFSGKRPLYKFECQSKSRQAYSRCIPEILNSIQQEMDYAHNLRNDALQLQVLPFGAYVSGHGLDAKPIRMKPGRWIPVQEINDIKTMHFNSSAHALLTEEEKLWEYAAWLLSVSPVSKGIVPENVGPLRSTSGVIKLLNQANEQFKPIIDQFAVQWKALELAIAEDLDYRMDPGLKLRVIGPEVGESYEALSAPEKFEAAQNFVLTKLFDIKVDVAEALETDEMRRDTALQILQVVSNPTLLHQAGVISPKGLYEAAKDYFEAWGKNPEHYIEEPELVGKPLTLYQEIQICGQGVMPPMSMQDNHEEKARQLIQFMQSPEFAEARQFFVEDVEVNIMKAAGKHQMLAEMLRPKGIAQSGGSPQGETQAGVSPQQGGRSPEETTGREVASGGQNQGQGVGSEALDRSGGVEGS